MITLFLLGNDDLAHGHAVVRELIGSRRLAFYETCRGLSGPVYAMTHYTWEDWARGARFERGPKEKPKEKHKDFPDIVRYVSVALYDGQIDYYSLKDDPRDIQLVDMSQGGYGRVS